MLRLVRRHRKTRKDGRKGCPLTSEMDVNCPSAKKCPIHVKGVGPDGKHIRKALGTCNWTRANELLHGLEAGVKKEASLPVTVATAIESYKQFKAKRSPDTKRKIKLLLGRLQTFLEKRNLFNVADVKLPDLVAFRETWTGADTTRRRDQEILKSFLWYCFHSDFIIKNPVIHLDPVSVGRPKTDPFTHEEQIALFAALEKLPDEYGRCGTPIAIQTEAFVYILKFTGMAIGDVAKLEKTAVQRKRVRTYRKKTGEEVFAAVPQFVVDALNSARHDSERYFFWSGEGLIHTRVSKWGDRLRKLFKLAKVDGTPYRFRHTLARDLLENGASMAEVAELLGNSVQICEKYYSKWDARRQDRLERNLNRLQENDPITGMLQKLSSGSSLPFGA